MKAERRHELKENTLVKKLATMPSFSRTYGPRILLGAVLVALVILVIYYRMNNSAAVNANLQKNLLDARNDLSAMANPDKPARQQSYSDGIRAAKEVLESADEKDELIRAQALIYVGDLNWAMANDPSQSVTSQPSMPEDESTSQMLDDAEKAYNDVVSKYPNQTTQVVAARLGLAAIAENRGAANRGQDSSQWDKARAQYQAIIDSNAPAAFQDLAKLRLSQVSSLQHPLVDLMPTTMASTRPATRPFVGPPAPAIHPPATRPATTRPH